MAEKLEQAKLDKAQERVLASFGGEAQDFVVTSEQVQKHEDNKARRSGQSDSALRGGDELTVFAENRIIRVPNARATGTQPKFYGGIAVSILRGGQPIADAISYNTPDATVFPVGDGSSLITKEEKDADGKVTGKSFWLLPEAIQPRFAALSGRGTIVKNVPVEFAEDGTTTKVADFFNLDEDIKISLSSVECYRIDRTHGTNGWDATVKAFRVASDRKSALTGTDPKPATYKVACAL